MTAAARLLETARSAGLSIEVEDGDLIVEADCEMPLDLLASLRQHKAELIAALTPAPDDPEERAAVIEEGTGVPRRWAEGFAVLCTMAPPPGFSAERWQRIVDAAGVFLDRWAAAAIRCGWSDLDVFGADADRPDARFDCMGLLMLLDRCEIVGIDEGGADLIASPEARLRYRRRPLPAHTVSLWQLGRARF
jgi:hypothetical protein